MPEVVLSVTLSALGAAALDQLTKVAAVRRLAPVRVPLVGTWLGLRRGLNRRGSPLGLSSRAAVLVGSGVILSLTVVIVAASPPLATPQSIGLGLVLGGAASNLADRLTRGGVVDFLELRWWPTFNLADAAMVTGTGLAAWGLL